MTALRPKRHDFARGASVYGVLDILVVELEGSEEAGRYQSGAVLGRPSLRRVACGKSGLFRLASPSRKFAQVPGARLEGSPVQRVQGLARSGSLLRSPASARGGF